MSYHRCAIAATLAILLLSFHSNASSSPTPQIDAADLKNIMLVKDVKPGMKGYGKTVFHGTKIETFPVEVLGVMKKAIMGADLVLVKLSGAPMTTRGANLIEGMSGSPIYINGKLLGAFAYGDAFGREPIGMVTPIEYMLEAWDSALSKQPSSFYPFSTSSLDKPIKLGSKEFSKVAIDYGTADGSRSGAGSDTLTFRPLAMPIMVSGLSPRMMSRLQESLGSLSVRPVAGQGVAPDKAGSTSSLQASSSADMQPGAAIGMSLVTGDIDITGIGTLTYRRGNKIVAFGHPMLALGTIDAPLTSAYVLDVFPSLYVSYKMAVPTKPIGRVFQDRPWSIAGEIGKTPKMIPVTVHVNNKSLGREMTFRANVIDHILLSKDLIPLVAGEALYEATGTPSDLTAKVKFEVVADEVGTITRENTYFDPEMIDISAISELQEVLYLLHYNQFHPVGIKKVEVWADITPKHQTAKLERIFLKESKFEPGDTIEIGAVLRPFKGERVIKTVKLSLPKNMPNGTMALMVSGGQYALGGPAGGGEGPGSPLDFMPAPTPGAPTMDNLQQLVKKFLERDKNNELVAKIMLPKPVPSIAGEKLTGLPPSIADAMKSSKATAFGSVRDEVKEALPTDWVIIGAQRLTITVQRTDKSEKKAPDKAESAPSEGDSSEPEPEAPPDESVPGDEGGDEDSMDFALGGRDLMTLAASEPSVAKPDSSEAKSEPAAKVDSSVEETTPDNAEEAKPKETSAAEEKPIGRAPSVWKQTAKPDFLNGTLKKTAATTGDLVTLSASLEALYETTEDYVWCVLPDGSGGVYAGTGNHGIIYKIGSDGKTSVLYDSPDLEVHSLAKDSSGNIYAGASPNGIVYKIGSDGKASTFFDAEEKYITALALDGKGNVYAATGGNCKVYRISPDGKPESVLDSSENHALSLAVDKDDNVYVGTGQSGIIYKISADGKTSTLYDAAEEAVTALAVDKDGTLYAGTSSKGVIYKLTPGTTPKTLYDKAGKGIVGIQVAEDGGIFAANATGIFKILPDDTVYMLGNDDGLQFMSLALEGGRLYTGTGSMGAVYVADLGKATEGTYESPVHDCKLASSWGVIDWTADTPAGSSVILQTRAGNSPQPDSTWSDWSGIYTAPGSKIADSPGRYIQYLATLKAADTTAQPKLKDVSIVYLAKNQAPKVTVTSPKGGEKWSRKKTIRWTCTDPDKDTIKYELFYSADAGATWQPLSAEVSTPTKENGEEPQKEETNGVEAPAEEEPSSVEQPDPQQIVADMAAELDKHPEIPQEVKDKILAEAPAAVEDAQAAMNDKETPAAETSAEKPSSNGTKQTSSSWDTTKAKDGIYTIKVTASDKLSNPVDALTGEAVSEPVTIVNTPPKVVAFKRTLTVQADKSVRVEGIAFQDMIGIGGVQYKVDSGDWAAAAASDGIFDTGFETFVVSTQPLEKGDHTIEIKAVDQAGNSATVKVQAEVE